MNKNRLIAVAIVAFLLLVPFPPAFINFTVASEFVQVMCMTLVILGSMVAIVLYNKGTEQSNEQH